MVRAPGIEAQENYELVTASVSGLRCSNFELPFYEGIKETLVLILLGDKNQ